MRAVCAWCKTDLGARPGPEGKVTHGICPPCRKRVSQYARCTDGLGIVTDHAAEGWLVEPHGQRIQGMCRVHALACIREYAEVLGEPWTFEEEEAR